MNLLLVDDDQDHIELISRAFSGSAVKITSAGSLREYREIIARERPDIAVIDLNLPDGKALEALKAPAEANPYPVLIMTGQGDEKSAVAAIKAGALDYIVKSAETVLGMPHAVERAMREWELLKGSRAKTEALNTNMALTRTILDTMQGGIIIVDAATREIVDVNQYALRLAGATRQEMIGTVCHKYVCPAEMGKCPVCDLKQKVDNSERKFLKGDGTAVSVLKTVVPLDLAGRACLLEHFVDITQLKLAEEKAQRAQKMELVGRMAGSVAHDFNNLLAALQADCSFLLNTTPKADPRRPDMEEIGSIGERAATLVKQLLVFSRKNIVKPAVLDMNSVVSGMEKLLCTTAGGKVKLKISLSTGAGKVKADPDQMGQVLMNLVANARDAMPEGGSLLLETGVAEISGGASDELQPAGITAGKYLTLTVTDSGTGMAEDVKAHLFEPFFTTKEPGKGTGLGLATIYDIVTKNSGFIGVKSAPAQGTSFRVFLPEFRPEAAQPAAEPGGLRVLLIEDDAELREVTAGVLKNAGYRVIEAGSAMESLARAREGFDIIVADVCLPDASGPDLAGRLVAENGKKAVVLTSAYLEKEEVRSLVSDPGRYFLPKPFSSAALLDMVGKALSAAA